MSIEANKVIVRRFYEEVESQGHVELIDELFAPNFVDTGHPERGAGPESVRAHVIEMRTRFPDLTVTVDQLVAEDDWVVAKLTSRGTHLGPFAGLQPTGTAATWTGVGMRRIVDGRIIEQWTKYDMISLLRQLGALRVGPVAPPET
ncbi:MAG: ester cyclase [Dehalococcoidia bacterium]